MAKKPTRKIGASAPKKHRGVSERSKANLKPAWKPGQSGNPAGRAKGSRNRLTEKLLENFADAWDCEGGEQLRFLMSTDPATFVRLAVSLIPKQLEVEAQQAVYVIGDRPLSADEWASGFAQEDSDVVPASGTAASPDKLPAARSVLRRGKGRRKD